jgi:hypothetical protein
MKLQPPVNVSQQQISIDVSEIEPLLQAPPMDVPAWPEAMIKLNDGRILIFAKQNWMMYPSCWST